MGQEIIIYTDGACSGNPGPGGWGFIIEIKNSEKPAQSFYGGEINTTNNRMEMMAVIKSLEHVQSKEKMQIKIHTDSKYVQKGITEWLVNWKKNKWKTASKKPVKNQDLWEKIDHLKKELNIEEIY